MKIFIENILNTIGKNAKSTLAILLTFAFVSFVNYCKADHYMGGEITWKCIPSGQPDAGKFIFQLKVYRECYNSSPGVPSAEFGNRQNIFTDAPISSGSNIIVNILTGWPKDISPVCNSNSAFSRIYCIGMPNGDANMGAVQEYIYVSNPVQINGVPPAQGWTFYWSSCCRNPSANIVNGPGTSFYLRAKMYAFNNQNTFPCFDNSPTFAEVPRTVICTGYPFTYNHNAYDKELDSLRFDWGQPLDGKKRPVAYTSVYSYNNPLPGPFHNSNNVSAVVDNNTGNISFTSYTTGAYVTSSKVTAYKCGQKVAEIWRDMQVVLLACGTNKPPEVTPPFNNGTSYIDTVYAGEIVKFDLNAQDFEYLPNGDPQTMYIEASGAQFGEYIPKSGMNTATYSDTKGCINPPCATLTPAPHPIYPLSGVLGIQTSFKWKTDCDHLASTVNCVTHSNVYTFVLKVLDDYCPAPAISYANITIVVLPKPIFIQAPIQCLSVKSSGDVELKWSTPLDSLDAFKKYLIYYSKNKNGPFQLIDSIGDITVNKYFHKGADANNGQRFYQLKIRSGCDGSLKNSPSDTFSTINLNVNNVNNQIAELKWNAINNPLNNTSSEWYYIYKENTKGNWLFVDSTQNTFYKDSVSVCSDSIMYRVEITDTSIIDFQQNKTRCHSNSNTNGNYFEDNIVPDKPIIDSVSINSKTKFVEIGWTMKDDVDVEAYVIHTKVNGFMTPVDTVIGKENTFYIDKKNIACSSENDFNTYSVLAIDSCGNSSLLSDEHNTLFVETNKNICDDIVSISWNNYNNFEDGLSYYIVYVKENGKKAIPLDTLSNSVTNYIHTGLKDMSEYCYYIKAVSATAKTSTSCSKCIINKRPTKPQFIYIRSASVYKQNNNGVRLMIHTDTAAKVSKYRIERSSRGADWDTIGFVTPNYFNPSITYNDYTAVVSELSYLYRVVAVDSCGDDAVISNKAMSIFLKATPKDSMINYLQWNSYIGFDGYPTSYYLYRAVDGIWENMPYIIPVGSNSYEDNVSGLNNTGGVFTYYISAIEGMGNVYQFEDTAYSNTVMALQKPRLYVPTAFSPQSRNSENREFKCFGVFVSSDNFLLIVYNRWGQKVFETNDINAGWNGKYKGEEVPAGVYTYIVKFVNSSGEPFENRGTIMLIR